MKFWVKFRRILLATALLAVLASSLFSGWLTSNQALAIGELPQSSPIYTFADFQKWFSTDNFKDFSDQRIVGLQPANKNVVPYIDIAGNPDVGRPTMRFRLAATRGTGLLTSANVIHFVFAAYDIVGGKEILIPNLYFGVTNECELLLCDVDNPVIDKDGVGGSGIYYSASDIVHSVDDGSFTLFNNTVGVGRNESIVNWDDINLLFRHTLINGTSSLTSRGYDCLGIGTDPSKLRYVGPTRTQQFHPKSEISDIDILFLNSNCIDGTPEGWLVGAWKVKVKSDATEAAECGIGALVKDGINVGVIISKILACVFNTLLSKGLDTVLDLLTQTSERSMIDPRQILLIRTALGVSTTHAADLQDELKSDTSAVVSVWKYCLSLLNIVVVLALLAIAFANISPIKINNYIAKKSLPGLVLGVVGANASLLIVRFMVDVANAVSMLAVDLGGVAPSLGVSGLIAKLPIAIGQNAMTAAIVALVALGPFALIGALILILYFFFLILVFVWALFRRLVMLYFLIMLAPLAFAAYGVPGLQQYFTKWWDLFLRYLFLLPILLFGIALVVKLGDKINTGSFINVDQLSIPGAINLMIMLAAATAILKLPNVITKGAIDISGAAQKAFGLAKAAPAAGMAIGQGWHANKARELKVAALRNKKDKPWLHDVLMKESKTAEEKSKKWGRGRGMAYIAGNPDKTLQSWVKSRSEGGEKASNVEALKLKGKYSWFTSKRGMADTIAGEEGYGARRTAAWDTIKEASSIREARNTADAAGKIIDKIEEAAKKMTPDEALQFRKDWAGAKNPTNWKKVVDKLREYHTDAELETAGLNVNQLDYPSSVASAFYQWAIQEGKRTGSDTADERLRGRFGEWVSSDWQGAGSAAPFGLFGGPDRPPDDNPPNPPGGGGTPPQPPGGNGGAVDVRVVGQTAPIQIDQADFDGRLSQVMEHAQSLKDNIGEGELAALAKHTVNANPSLDDIDLNGLKSALVGVIDSAKPASSDLMKKIDGAEIKELVNIAHDLSIAIGKKGGAEERTVEAVSQRLQNAYGQSGAIDQHNQDIASRLDEQKLAQIMSGSLNEAMAGLQDVLGGNLDQINETLKQSGAEAKDRLTVLQNVVGELQGMRENFSGRGKNSFRNVIDNMGSRLAKHMGMAHLSIGQQIKQAAANQPNIVVQSTPVQPATPASQPLIAQSENLEPPATPDNSTKP